VRISAVVAKYVMCNQILHRKKCGEEVFFHMIIPCNPDTAL